MAGPYSWESSLLPTESIGQVRSAHLCPKAPNRASSSIIPATSNLMGSTRQVPYVSPLDGEHLKGMNWVCYVSSLPLALTQSRHPLCTQDPYSSFTGWTPTQNLHDPISGRTGCFSAQDWALSTSALLSLGVAWFFAVGAPVHWRMFRHILSLNPLDPRHTLLPSHDDKTCPDTENFPFWGEA